MKFLRASPQTVNINLASLIKVVSILLRFFVMTTTFTRETQLRMNPSDVIERQKAGHRHQRGRGLSVKDQLLPKNNLASLIGALQKKLGVGTSLLLSLSTDGKTQHQAVITPIGAAVKLSFSYLRMTTVEAKVPY